MMQHGLYQKMGNYVVGKMRGQFPIKVPLHSLNHNKNHQNQKHKYRLANQTTIFTMTHNISVSFSV